MSATPPHAVAIDAFFGISVQQRRTYLSKVVDLLHRRAPAGVVPEGA